MNLVEICQAALNGTPFDYLANRDENQYGVTLPNGVSVSIAETTSEYGVAGKTDALEVTKGIGETFVIFHSVCSTLGVLNEQTGDATSGLCAYEAVMMIQEGNYFGNTASGALSSPFTF